MAEYVRFVGARIETSDGAKVITPRGDIYINPERVNGFYDHVILVSGHKICVVDGIDEITKRLRTERF